MKKKKKLSCSGLHIASYWYIDTVTTASEISCSNIQPCSHRIANLGSPHDYPQPKPVLWCYIIPHRSLFTPITSEILHAPHKDVDVVFWNSAMCHYHRCTLSRQTHRRKRIRFSLVEMFLACANEYLKMKNAWQQIRVDFSSCPRLRWHIYATLGGLISNIFLWTFRICEVHESQFTSQDNNGIIFAGWYTPEGIMSRQPQRSLDPTTSMNTFYSYIFNRVSLRFLRQPKKSVQVELIPHWWKPEICCWVSKFHLTPACANLWGAARICAAA